VGKTVPDHNQDGSENVLDPEFFDEPAVCIGKVEGVDFCLEVVFIVRWAPAVSNG
jgi:hypothetical protein